ncbi:response regulator [Paeniglutamicibacter cryotolerans]|uniref:DNA-binding NarL/FixJ family response regulator n=1 Tax=Paeniglutamicibacter cryotolerans TaxID=670079 RepID=A0A839QJX3_9MICC|nr:response regulator transcription factor [Paeniglutamicibacter cryotolerans]MBB2996137.1 DNA-binding NarL/FixJ family response regulator [Paeniglutamicibacter cryotolerans]
MSPIKVVLADDQDLIRAGLAAILGPAPDIDVAAEAANGLDAAEAAAANAADVVLMDIQMPGSSGIDGLEQIAASGSGTRVLMLSMFDLDEYVYAALRAGASGFLLKTTPAARLLEGIRACHAGGSLFAPEITRRLVESFVSRPPAPAGIPAVLTGLTGRELEVFDQLPGGLSNAEIGAALYLGETTVKTHVTRILAKLGLRDRVQGVVLAYECGFRYPGRNHSP